jgi:hypothetical protein
MLYFISGVVLPAQISINTPPPGSTFTNARVVAIQATVASNASEVDFYNGKDKKAAVRISINNIFAYDWVMTSADNGTNDWTAVALDPNGRSAGTSSVVSLVVNIPKSAAPSIIMQPHNRKVIIGRNATFRVLADGAPPLSYQWSFEGMALPANTAVALKLTAVTTNLAGSYTVTVSNAFGVVTSRPAKLEVISALQPPADLQPPSGFRIVQ